MPFALCAFIGCAAIGMPLLAANPAGAQIVEEPVLPPSLKQVPVPPVPNLQRYVKSEAAALLLGKALFWDMQLGSDGATACASCHFHAGVDSRAANQGHPGSNGLFNHMRPNKTATPGDFPFMNRAAPDDRASQILSESDDVFGSQGVFRATFAAFDPLVPGDGVDQGTLVADPVFHLFGQPIEVNTSTRQVTGRNSPSVIMAAYNAFNFWDGRADRFFNGVNPFGDGGLVASPGFTIQRDDDGQNAGGWATENVNLEWAALASQAVGPPMSATEMSWAGRDFRQLGRKMLQLQPLAKQLVAPTDSVLGSRSRAPLKGLQTPQAGNLTYADMVRDAFQEVFWDSQALLAGPENYTLMENNFSLFFGLAVMMYERTLIPDDTKFDRVLEERAVLTAQEQIGLEIFFDRGRFNGIGGNPLGGRCHVCHFGAEFTSASSAGFLAVAEAEGGGVPNFVEFMAHKDGQARNYDIGFYNLAVRPSAEDLGRGGTDVPDPTAPGGFRPLSQGRRMFKEFLPSFNSLIAVDGHFKTPSLRNVELTGPYMHNGGFATLMHVIDFYARGGDFPHATSTNPTGGPTPRRQDADMPPAFAPDEGVPFGNTAVLVGNEANQEALVAFLLTLTDDRVKFERAPFDHPQLFVANGEPEATFIVACSDAQKINGICSNMLEIAAVGAEGRELANPLQTFLNLDPFNAEGAVVPPRRKVAKPFLFPGIL